MGQFAAPLQVAAGVVNAAGEIAQGAGRASAYQYNANVARQQAEVARQQSYMKAYGTEQQVAQVAGAQAAGFGKAGVRPSLWLAADTARKGQIIRQQQLYQGRLEALSQQRQADIYHAQATQARTGSYISAGGTLLGSLASAAGGMFIGGGDTTTIPGIGGNISGVGSMGRNIDFGDLIPKPVSLSIPPESPWPWS